MIESGDVSADILRRIAASDEMPGLIRHESGLQAGEQRLTPLSVKLN